MKKILLSLVALMAVVVGASADSYTATGVMKNVIDEKLDTLLVGGYNFGAYSPLIELSDRTVEVSSDSIIVKDWYGYGNTSTGEPYDLVVYLDDNGNAKSFSAKVGSSLYPYGGSYVYTGYSYSDSPNNYCVGFTTWTETYAAYTQSVNDAENKAGYLFLYGTEWYSGKAGYYFITWGDYKFDKSLYTYTATGNVRSAIEENKDSLIIGDYTWGAYSPLVELSDRTVEVNSDSIIVKDWYGYGNTSTGEPYDLVVYLDDNGNAKSFSAKVGSSLYPYGGSYVYTGYSYSDSPNNYCVGFTTWTETYAAYTQSVNDAANKAGYLFLYGTEWYSGKSGYYFIPWGNYKFDVKKYDTSAIISASAERENANAPMYNLAGQRVSPSAKGLVIKNGKKMILK